MEKEDIRNMLRETSSYREDLTQLNEELNKADEKQVAKIVKDELDKELKKRDFERKLGDAVASQLDSNKKLEKKVVNIASNVVTQLFKTLWVRRNVWRSRLQNKAN